jgi:hypothetical protein
MAHLAAITPAACVARAGPSYVKQKNVLDKKSSVQVFAPRTDNARRHTGARRVVVTAAATEKVEERSGKVVKGKGAGWVSDELPDEVDVCIIGRDGTFFLPRYYFAVTKRYWSSMARCVC